MALASDVSIQAAKFDPTNYSQQTVNLHKQFLEGFKNVPKWYEVGAAKYRDMIRNGEPPFPPPKLDPDAIDIQIPSRDPDRLLTCRLVYPSSRKSKEERKRCRGTVYHIHGGGWVMGDHTSTDWLLRHYADTGDLAVISVGYRLAPEDPYPKGVEDCIDGAEYLLANSPSEYGGPLKFIGGESAGAHLSLLVTFHLLKKLPEFQLDGLLLPFGHYDLSHLPSVRNFEAGLVVNFADIEGMSAAHLPGLSLEQRKDPLISPYYENLEKFRGRLPSALFQCGTEDPLLDDTVSMGTKWMIAGGDAIIKVYPGAAHGFLGHDPAILKEAADGMQDLKLFIESRLAIS